MDNATTAGQTQSTETSYVGIVNSSDNLTNVTVWPACYLNKETPKTKELLKGMPYIDRTVNGRQTDR